MKIVIALTLVMLLASACQDGRYASIQDEAKESACRSNMKNLATAESMYFAHNRDGYTEAAGLESSEIMGNASSLTCPADGTPYLYTIENTQGQESYTITCQHGHGSVTDGICSWQTGY